MLPDISDLPPQRKSLYRNLGPISRQEDHADDKCLFVSAKSGYYLLQKCHGRRFRTTRHSSNGLLSEIVKVFVYRNRDT